jgi:hypothetical protein
MIATQRHRNQARVNMTARVGLVAAVSAFVLGALPPSNSTPIGSERVVLSDKQPYGQGRYFAYASPWSTLFDKSLRHGSDYADTITLDPLTFPDGTAIDTRWPTTKPKNSGVWGYHAISFGNYDDGHPPIPVTPHQVKDIRQLSEQFAFNYRGDTNFNLLNEFYLTSRAGDAAAKVIEIGFFLHIPAPSLRYVHGGRPITSYQDTFGHVWMVRRTGNFITITPINGQDLAQGSIDVRWVLDLLLREHVITGHEWFNGIAFGVEPTEGGGTTDVLIERWHVNYQ